MGTLPAALFAALLQIAAPAASDTATFAPRGGLLDARPMTLLVTPRDASSAAGTWHFTGLDGQLTSASAGSAGRVQGSVTVAASGALTFSWDPTADLTLSFAADPAAPACVTASTVALIAGAAGATFDARAKLLKIDADTWTLQTVSLARSGATVTGGRVIAGILHRDPLPAPGAAVWEREVDSNDTKFSLYGDGGYYNSYEGAATQCFLFNQTLDGPYRAYFYGGGEDCRNGAQNTWRKYYAVTRSADGGIWSRLIHGGDPFELHTKWEGSTFYYTETYKHGGGGAYENKDKWENGVWYRWDDRDNAWKAEDGIGGLLPDGSFYAADDGGKNGMIFGKRLLFQLPGDRLALAHVSFDAGGELYSRAWVESTPFGSGDSNGNGGGNSGGGEGGGGGGAPVLPALALLAALLALRVRKK
ncbi:hypothetical protein OH491_14085 [Termitidicoccus mucosus]|uniref:Uncharacterized protein n=1 Tax=Termitidicoccus mucosus TaxID=1184151 RepID=A0A178IJF1_9BACT|nr:hypothetical protein AW736_13370 [Opitutaceae bacterium TSB47]